MSESMATLEELRASLLRLTTQQQIAVEALATGATHQEAADRSRVSRETVTKWTCNLPAFKAALNRYRLALAWEQYDLARRVRGKALGAIETALDLGQIDPIAVLRVVGETRVPLGSTIAESILDEEMNQTLLSLPPIPPPRGLEAQLQSLSDPGPSEIERAEEATINRLALALSLHHFRIESADAEGD